VSYVPRYDPSFKAIVVNAGIAHGVTDGAEFAFYAAQESNPRGKPLGTYIVDKATSFYSTMKPAGGLSGLSGNMIYHRYVIRLNV